MSSNMPWNLEVCKAIMLYVAMPVLCESAVYCKKQSFVTHWLCLQRFTAHLLLHDEGREEGNARFW